MSCIGQNHLRKGVQCFEEAFHQTTCVLDLNFIFELLSSSLILYIVVLYLVHCSLYIDC